VAVSGDEEHQLAAHLALDAALGIGLLGWLVQVGDLR